MVIPSLQERSNHQGKASWVCIDLYGFVWICFGFAWICFGFAWICFGFAWICLDLLGFALDLLGMRTETSWVCMDLLWICMDLYGFAWICHGFALDLLQIRCGFVVDLLWMSPVFNTPLACEAVPGESV